VIGFRTIYVQDELPTKGPVCLYDDGGDIVMLVHEPSLLEDPKGVIEHISAHCHHNVIGHLWQLQLTG
jgi:hypothetical protein